MVAGGAALVSETWHRLIRVRNTFGPDKIREAAATGWAGDVSKTQSELAWQPAVPIRERFAEFARQWRYGTA